MDVDAGPLDMRVATAATAAVSSSSSCNAVGIDAPAARHVAADVTSAAQAYSKKADAAATPYDTRHAMALSQLISGLCDSGRSGNNAAKPEHSTRLRAPAAHEFEGGTATSILSYFAATMNQMLAAEAETPLPPPPDFVTTEHVRAVLCPPYGELQRCAMGEWCGGRRLPGGGTILMSYVSPRELRNYTLTGVLPKSPVEKRPCYLCLLFTANTCIHMAENAEVPVKHVRMPFAHLIDAPGGYRRCAMHSASSAAGGVTTALRSFCTKDYRPLKRRVAQPVINASTREVTWKEAEVLGYEEDASLLHGTNADPSASGVCPAPLCEDLLAAEVLRDVKFGAFGAHVSRAVRLYGPAVPTQFDICEEPARLRESLALCSFELGAVRLDYALLTQGDAVLLALAPRSSWKPPFALVEDLAYVGGHKILALLFLKFDVLTALLLPQQQQQKPEKQVAAKCIALLDALQPMLAFVAARHDAKKPLADTDMLTPDSSTDWAPFAQLYPAPAPVYFSAADLLRHAHNKLSFAAPPAPPYLSTSASVSVLYDLHAQRLRHAPQILRDAMRARAQVCANTLRSTIEWLAHRTDRHTIAQLADDFVPTLPFVDALPADGGGGGKGLTLAQLYNNAEYTPLLCRQVNARLSACLATGSPTMSVWAALVLRAAVLTEMLRADERELHTDEYVRFICCGGAARAVSDAFSAAIERSGAVDVEQDIVPAFVGGTTWHASERHNAMDVAARVHALRLALGAHARACARMLLHCAAENSDVGVMTCVGDLRPDDGRVAALLRLTRAPPAALAALTNAQPSAAVHTAGLVADLRAACAADANFRAVFAAMTAATMCGEYAHSREMPSFRELVRLQLCLLADGGVAYALTRKPAALAVVARDFALALFMACPARMLFRATRLTNFDGWARAVEQSASALRVSRTADALWPPESARMQKAAAPAHSNGDFLASVAKLFRAVDIEVISWTTIANGRPLADADLAMPERLLTVLADYVRALPLHQGFRVEWLASAGIDRRLVTIMRGLADADAVRPSTEVVREMAYLEPVHYAICSMFVRLCTLQKAWSAHRLDCGTALRQLRAVLERDGALVPQVHSCGVTRITCCNRICDVGVQPNPMHTGFKEVRTAIDVNKVRCRHRPKKPPADRATKGTEAAARVAIANYTHVLADLATHAGTISEKEVRDRRAAAREEMRHEVSQYAGVQHKKLCQTPCGAPLHFVPLVGAVVEHATALASQSQQQQRSAAKTHNCTLCPSCGSKTRFAPAMIGPNGFTCGLCDADVRLAVLSVRRGDDVCCMCDISRCALAQQSACCLSADGSVFRARLRPVVVADDCTVRGVVRRSVTYVCTLCHGRWMTEALLAHVTLSQLRVLKRLQLGPMTCLDELLRSSHDVDMRTRLSIELHDLSARARLPEALRERVPRTRPAALKYPLSAISQWTGVAEGIVQKKTAATVLNSQLSARITASRRRVRTDRERAETAQKKKRARVSAAATTDTNAAPAAAATAAQSSDDDGEDVEPISHVLEEFASDGDDDDDGGEKYE
jgi:hypothetical protein